MTDGFKRRTPSRWGEGGALREEILAAAARLLAESGREGDLSLRAVAREVGISAPSIYLHFEDRAELVSTLTRRAYERLVGDLRAARERGAVDGPRAGLRAMTRRYCALALDNPKFYRLMFGIERIEVPREELASHPLWLVAEAWHDAVAACRPGAAEESGDRRVAKLLWFSLHGVVAMAMSTPFQVDRQALEEMADDLLDLALTR
ncbi:TetR/AcrR family transcriptional regulator [Streptomyces tubbatahanensis]|uniref:TetR/AcrR family transcriptional regulator n=1 Tax=Streptomyces tubbatahanensis TaxID=2923272 RepID=A0ABY3XLB0_9ACTN|nr:TetR/AcrR family transcriptional regulator [Streptomyces tubbatahanensis]UNS95193.1 TetR/AcrR family transcriptional regulator [Streptomyces tubbatahanensis]